MEKNHRVLDQEGIQLLHQIRKELSLESIKEAVVLVTSVLQALRQTLTLEKAELLLNKLPDFLKLIFIANWRRNERNLPIDHLDEFVNLVMIRERNNKSSFFRNEVQTLSAVILTLKKLYTLAGLNSFEGLSQPMRQELRDATMGAAA